MEAIQSAKTYFFTSPLADFLGISSSALDFGSDCLDDLNKAIAVSKLDRKRSSSPVSIIVASTCILENNGVLNWT